MRTSHIGLCLLACLLWSGNFIAVKIGLNANMTPFLMTALRFAAASCLIPFVIRPSGVSWGALALIGTVIGVGQFGAAGLSIAVGVPPGFVALILQTQAILTVALARLCFGETISCRMIVGGVVAIAGVGLLTKLGGAGTVTGNGPALATFGLLLALVAACSAGAGNILIKRLAGTGNALHLAIWISPFPVMPLIGLSLLTEPSPMTTLPHLYAPVAAAVIIYGGLVSAVGGTAIWAWLLKRNPAGQVALFSPAIPVFAFALSSLCFGERLDARQVAAIGLIIVGVLVASPAFAYVCRSLLLSYSLPTLKTSSPHPATKRPRRLPHRKTAR
jgi:O-acetylserine/cysteine efflux transporter